MDLLQPTELEPDLISADGPRLRPKIRWAYVLCVTVPLIIVNCDWIANSEIRNNLTEGTVSTLFMGVLFILFLLTLINLAVRKVAGPLASLNQAELLAIYTLLSISSALAGVSFLGFLPLCLAIPSHYASTTPGAGEIPYLLPSYMGPRNPAVLLGFYKGRSSFFQPAIYEAWMAPLLVWSVFLIVLLWTMLCLGVMFRRRWEEEEHLPFPVIALPVEITREGAPIYRNKVMWAGFAIPCFLHSLNTMHGLFPLLPSFPINSWNDLGRFLPYPWSGAGVVFGMIHPVGVGFGYLVGTDVSFSLWFLYLVKKALYVIGVLYGWRQANPGDWNSDSQKAFPFTSQQGLGAWIALALSAFWGARSYFKTYFNRAWRGDPEGFDRNEPLSARTATIGFLVGYVALCIFIWSAGGSFWLPVVFLLLYLLIMTALSRMRAETAILSMGLGDINPQNIITGLVGVQSLSQADTVHMGMLSWFNLDYRSAVMPQEIEGLVAQDRAQGNSRPLVYAILFAAVVAILAATITELQMYYVNGAESADVVSWRNIESANVWRSFENLKHNPTSPTPSSITAIIVGFGMTFLLAWLRTRFVGFPLHPAAYVLNTSPANDYFWVDMLVAWAVKVLIMRYGGLKMYRNALPFFLGLILGDFVTGSAWCLVGTIMHVNLFRTFPV
jgi:hypothetical protein